MSSVEAYRGNLERREPSQYSLLDPGKPRKTCVEMAGRTARHHLHCTALFMNIRWKWVSYFFYSHSELAIMFASPQFWHIICFLQCCLQMNRLHWSHFVDSDECFRRPHMKQLPRFFSGLPAMSSPSSTGSGRYFSRNAETSPGSEGIWDLDTRCFH